VELIEGDGGRIAAGEHRRLLRTESDMIGIARLVYVTEGPYLVRIAAPGRGTVELPIHVLADAGDYPVGDVVLLPPID
jgi:hypothetical protein